MTDSEILKPHMSKVFEEYCVYIPYFTDDLNHGTNTDEIAFYFGYPSTRHFGEPSYTYDYGNNVYEIGFIYQSLEEAQRGLIEAINKITSKGCKVNYHNGMEIELVVK